MSRSDLTVQPARPEQREEAFRLLFRHLPGVEHRQRVRNALGLMHRGEMSADSLLVAGRGGRVVGAVVCLPVAGAAALVWPPGAADGPAGDRQAVEDALLAHATRDLRGRGVKLAQTLLTREELGLAEPLLRNGFRHVTRLWYLQHDLHAVGPRRRDGWGLASLADGVPETLFLETLVRTYQGTLDCPELNGLRRPEAVMEGHRSQGRYDPGHWWLACRGDEPAGVLILAEQPDLASYDISYVGVAPGMRRRGLGRVLTGHALRLASAEGAPRVTLAVDARNTPAWDLYLGLGFRPRDQREVILAIWP